MSKFYKDAANNLGANKAMVSLMNQGKVSYSEGFEEGVAYGEETVARGIEKGEISRLEAMQEEKRGGDQVRAHYLK